MVSIKNALQKEGEKLGAVAAEPVQGGRAHGENYTCKKIETEKRLKELLYIAQMDHLYGGSKISKTSNSSNSSKNNSNFGGSDLAGPPVR